MSKKKDVTEDFGSSDCSPVMPRKIAVNPQASVSDAANLPREFVTYFSDRGRGMRYSRIAIDNWDEWIWSGEWIFSDNVGDVTALREFQNAEHVAVLIR
ncbi:MAG: hypothetical protein WBD31_06415 [Rubripirellula sp.]